MLLLPEDTVEESCVTEDFCDAVEMIGLQYAFPVWSMKHLSYLPGQQMLPQRLTQEEALEACEDVCEEADALDGVEEKFPLRCELAPPWQSLSVLQKSGPAPHAILHVRAPV